MCPIELFVCKENKKSKYIIFFNAKEKQQFFYNLLLDLKYNDFFSLIYHVQIVEFTLQDYTFSLTTDLTRLRIIERRR